ncbi:MAG TPA: glycoside hydrolase family 31 protein, partial [Candidatus Binataceae bacterium]|nr:glycoside hydrolase family 31 protein [Candidatus Binataceae bacterium]
PFRLRYRAIGGGAFLEEAPDGGLSWSYWDYALRYALAPEDHFYAMGQPDQAGDSSDLDHRGHLREVWNQHSPPASTVFPALVSARGYGLLIDNPCRAVWDLGHTDENIFSYRARGGGLQYYVMYGPDLQRLSRTYFELTGFPPMPPRWTLGLLQSRYGYRNRKELEQIAAEFRQRRLPCDALILDVFWFREMGDLAFDAFQWPQPREMIARLRERGFRVVTIEEPYLTTKSRNYPEALSGGYLARRSDGSPYTFDFWPGECALVDFTNPAARAWWTAKHQALLELGIAGWWADLNEPAKHFQDMAHHGGSAAAIHNSFALHMHQAIHDAHQQFAPERRIFILSRSAFPGSQRYGVALWSGDVDMTFTALRKQIALGLNVGLAGIPLWGTDIGGFGFGGECTAELYVRWFQFGALCPLFRPHGDQTQLREPWQFGPEIEEICRKYIRLRYRLLPYIYSALRDACAAGPPMMRALVLEFRDDPEVYNLADEYLFGRDILVAPIVCEGADSRSVYLPSGGWVDFWTDELHFGPGRMTVDAGLDVIPLFVRQGAIIPTGPDVQYSSERPLDPLTLEIYSGADCSHTLYEDDGETNYYQNGAYAETTFRLSEGRDALTCHLGEARGDFAGFDPERTVVLNIHRQSRAGSVDCDGVAVPALTAAQSPASAQTGWWWNDEKGILSIKLPGSRTARVVRVRKG